MITTKTLLQTEGLGSERTLALPPVPGLASLGTTAPPPYLISIVRMVATVRMISTVRMMRSQLESCSLVSS